MKLGVVGNCQVTGIGLAMKQLRPDIDVVAIDVTSARLQKVLEPAAAAILACDVILTHRYQDGYGPLNMGEIAAAGKNVTLIPSITFTGFHPDCLYISGTSGTVSTVLGSYNSAIAAAAFVLGADEAKALSLFNGEVYKKLGYFDEHAKAAAFMKTNFKALNVDLSEEWAYWMAHAPFMHTVNHPRAEAINSLTKLLAHNAGLAPYRHEPVPMVIDTLSAQAIWAHYPEIAEAHGTRGSYLFKLAGFPRAHEGNEVLMSLEEYVRSSFAGYRAMPPGAVDGPTLKKHKAVLETLL